MWRSRTISSPNVACTPTGESINCDGTGLADESVNSDITGLDGESDDHSDCEHKMFAHVLDQSQ